jgi:hypothetical protein
MLLKLPGTCICLSDRVISPPWVSAQASERFLQPLLHLTASFDYYTDNPILLT